MRKQRIDTVVSGEQLEIELRRTELKMQRFKSWRRLVSCVILLGAMIVLAVTVWLPVYRIFDCSMQPLLQQGQIVLGYRGNELNSGDIAALHYDDQILIRCVIASSGDLISVNEYGELSINGKLIEYANLKKLSDGNEEPTYQFLVPENHYVVVPEHISDADISVTDCLTCIEKERIAAKIFFRIWPLQTIGYIG